MSWRYQPVWIDSEVGRVFSLCEVYLDDEGKVKNWTEKPKMTPVGNDIDDLKGALSQMLEDAGKWVPVRHADLKVGMVLQRATGSTE